MLAALSTHAWAKGYGELARFGLEKKNMRISEGVTAFGADPANNDVYVAGEEGKEESGQYKVQRLELAPHKSKVLASLSFTAPIEAKEELVEAPTGIEGIAVDSAKQRIYVLVRYERAVCEEYEPGKEYCPNNVNVAGALYAFSTASGGLTAVGSEGGLIAGFNTLKATSTAPGGALLDPEGITLDPVTHEVVILGEVNEGTLVHPSMHAALWSVNEKGEVGAAKYVSPKSSAEEERQPGEYNSPVVSSGGGIYFQRESLGGELYSVPASLSSSSPPAPAFDFSVFEGPLREAFKQRAFEFGTSDGDENLGATFSLSPEGVAYSAAEIEPFELQGERVVEAKGSAIPGVAAFNYTAEGEKLKFSDRGWTGGREDPEGRKVCAIGFLGETYWMVAAGKEGKLFVLNNPTETPGDQGEVIEFGPTEGAEKERTEAEECPEASVTRPRAEVSGSVVSSASTAAEVKLVSEATANILKAEWSFGDGSPIEKVETGEYQTAAVVHKFLKTGKLKVSVTVETDDLAGVEKASKTTKEMEINVEAAPPEAKATYSANGLEVTFNGGGSSAPPGEAIKAYHWSFGDGATAETSAPSVAHSYAGAGKYKVELTVSTEHQTSHPFSLQVEVSNGGGGGPGGPGGPSPGGGTTTTTTTTTPTSPPNNGILGSKESSPNVTVAGTSLKVTPAGAFVIKLSCPAGEASCSGKLTVQTLNAVGAAKHKKAPLTLAVGSFTITGGQVKALTLHLSSKAKALLKRSHTLRAKVMIVAHNPAGASHTAQPIVTLRRA